MDQLANPYQCFSKCRSYSKRMLLSIFPLYWWPNQPALFWYASKGSEGLLLEWLLQCWNPSRCFWCITKLWLNMYIVSCYFRTQTLLSRKINKKPFGWKNKHSLNTSLLGSVCSLFLLALLSQTRHQAYQHASTCIRNQCVNNWLVNTSSGELSIYHLRLEPLFLFYHILAC